MQRRVAGFKEVRAWQHAYDLGLEVYRITATFPPDERFGLTQQARRSAVSVPSNIAEGWERGTRADYVRFLGMARGSLYELHTQLDYAVDLGYMNADDSIFEKLDETERTLNGLIRSLQPPNKDTPRP